MWQFQFSPNVRRTSYFLFIVLILLGGSSFSFASEHPLQIYFAGGSALTNPAGEWRDAIDSYNSLGGRSNAAGVLELPGLFIKNDSHLWLGLLPSLLAEEYSSNYKQTTSTALTHINLNASAFWFLNSHSASGWLYRFDAGFTHLHRYERNNGTNLDRYYNGVDTKASVGYALPGFSDLSFWTLNFGLFAVSAGAIQETGADFTIGIML
jgi:hypothetical protein